MGSTVSYCKTQKPERVRGRLAQQAQKVYTGRRWGAKASPAGSHPASNYCGRGPESETAKRQLKDSSQGAAKHFAASRAVPLCRPLVAGSSHGQQMSGTGALNAACVYAEAGDAAEDTVAEVCWIQRLALRQTAAIETCAMRCEDVHARARSSQVRADLGGEGGWGTPNTTAPSPSLSQLTHVCTNRPSSHTHSYRLLIHTRYLSSYTCTHQTNGLDFTLLSRTTCPIRRLHTYSSKSGSPVSLLSLRHSLNPVVLT